MPDLPELSVDAGELALALRPCGQAPKRNRKVRLHIDSGGNTLTVGEAEFERFATIVSARGTPGFEAIIDGPQLLALARRFPKSAELQLLRTDALELRSGGFAARLPLFPDRARRPFPENPNHLCKVEPKNDGRFVTPRGDRWDFSAQVPFPTDPEPSVTYRPEAVEALPFPESKTITAYLNTTYRYVSPHGTAVDLRIGEACPSLSSLIISLGQESAVFITAWNPRSRPTAPSANAAAQGRLRAALARAGASLVLDGEGQGDDPTWPAEESLLAIGVDFANAGQLAERFQQSAIVFVGRDGIPRLCLGYA